MRRGGSMKYIFRIENLDCANCGNKIEVRLNKEPYIKEAILNFMLKKLTIHVKEEEAEHYPEEKLRKDIEKLADEIEKGIKILSVVDEEEVYIAPPHEDCHCDVHDHEGSCECHTHNSEGGLSRNGQKLTSAPKAKRDNAIKNFLKSEKLEPTLLIVSIILLAIGAVLDQSILLIIAYICVGYDVVINAAKNFVKGKMLDENFLMTIATIAAFAIGEYPEAVAVMVFYKIGEYLQGKAVNYSRKEIEKAMDIRPSFARVIRNGKEQVVSPEAVLKGEIIEVRAGEKLPLDGVVIEGTSTLDTSMLTGEALPVVAQLGSKVLSGSINKEGVIKVEVTTSFKNSTVSKILELIENASSKKSKSENFITKFARWYTPIVVGLAILTAIVPSLITGNWQHWVYSSIIFLVISCPCALVVSVPLGFFAGIGAAAQVGVLVKGSNYLEELNTIDTVVFDKTGTITKGEFGVSQIIAQGMAKEELLALAARIEAKSNHPIAKSIVSAYGKLKDEEIIGEYKEISGEGIVVNQGDSVLLAGNEKLMAHYQIDYKQEEEIGSHVYVARDGQYLGCIVVADQIKADSKAAIAKLKAGGIKKVIMLTGDKKENAYKIGNEVGIDTVHAELLPQDKVTKLEEALKNGKVAFVGDGINDAPVLARADVGIAMGGVGSDAAIEASDIVLMTDELSSIADVMSIAKRTRKIVTQNIVFALGVKVIVLVLGILGIANMWLAIFADVGVSLLAVINSIRVLGKNVGYALRMVRGK